MGQQSSQVSLERCEPLPEHEILKTTLLNIAVCSIGTIDEALEWVRKESPAGTTNNWCIDDGPAVAPVKCKEFPNRTHYIFTC